LEYINNFFPTEVKIKSTDKIIVGQLSFFEQLGQLMARTPPKVVENYIKWRQTSASVEFLPKQFRHLDNQLIKQLSENKYLVNDWKTCVTKTLCTSESISTTQQDLTFQK
jgi:neprilysin